MSKYGEKEKAYFEYYGMLVNQQNMLMDTVRTSAYRDAFLSNAPDFRDKVVLDVGAGSGILSFFAVKAGAKKVYACEASGMAEYAKVLVKGNGLEDVIEVVRGKVEEITLPEKVDIIISEPMGVLLLHERMVESFLVARDRFLTPICASDGTVEGLSNSKRAISFHPKQMWPSASTICLAPFTDLVLYSDALEKVSFWKNDSFYDLDLSSLRHAALSGQFSQAIVGPIDSRTLLSTPESKTIDFCLASVESIQNFEIPFTLKIQSTGVVHGIAGWFDVFFMGTIETKILSTSPFCETTHWYQVRFLIPNPIAVNRGQTLSGFFRFKANDQRSFDITIEIKLSDSTVKSVSSHRLNVQQYWNLSFNPSTYNQSPEALGVYSEYN